MKYYIGIDLVGLMFRTLLVDENGKTYSEVKDNTERENVLTMYVLKSFVKLKV